MKIETPREIVKTVLELREAGETRQDLADFYDVAVSTIARWEFRKYGKYLPTLGHMGLSREKRQAIARLGGRAVSRDPAHMAAIGKRGGQAIASRGVSYMSEIGKLGGRASADKQTKDKK